MLFGKINYNVGDCVVSGMSETEDWGAWTEGHEMIMRFQTNSDSDILEGKINSYVYNGSQNVFIYVNGEKVYDDSFGGGELDFSFLKPGKGKAIEVRIELKDAISPSKFGENDYRTLGLGIVSMVFDENK